MVAGNIEKDSDSNYKWVRFESIETAIESVEKEFDVSSVFYDLLEEVEFCTISFLEDKNLYTSDKIDNKEVIETLQIGMIEIIIEYYINEINNCVSDSIKNWTWELENNPQSTISYLVGKTSSRNRSVMFLDNMIVIDWKFS